MVRGGFSLIEIIVVLALIGVMLAWSLIPSSMLTDKAHFSNYKIQLRDILQQSRNLARSRQECVAIMVQPNSIIATAYASCAGPFTGPGDAQINSDFDANVTLTPFDTANPLVLNPQGGILNYLNPTFVAQPSTIKIQALGLSGGFVILPVIGQISEQ